VEYSDDVSGQTDGPGLLLLPAIYCTTMGDWAAVQTVYVKVFFCFRSASRSRLIAFGGQWLIRFIRSVVRWLVSVKRLRDVFVVLSVSGRVGGLTVLVWLVVSFVASGIVQHVFH